MAFTKANYTQVPNDLLGGTGKGGSIEPGIMANLDGSVLKIILAVTRITVGYHQNNRRLSLTNMQKLTGLSRQGVLNAAAEAEKMDLIVRHQDSNVTEWSLAIQDEPVKPVDQQESEVVKSVDQLVNSLDQSGQLSRPPSKKETEKETTERNSVAPATENQNSHILSGTVNSVKDQLQDAPDDLLQSILDLERSGKNRVGIIKFIEHKLNGNKAPADWGDMFKGLVDLCQYDTAVLTGRDRGELGAATKTMIAGGYSPELIKKYEGWWYNNDWRGIKGQPPTLAQFRATWGQFIKGVNGNGQETTRNGEPETNGTTGTTGQHYGNGANAAAREYVERNRANVAAFEAQMFG